MGQYRSYPGNLNYQNPLARLQSPLLGLGSLPPFDARSQNLCGECGQPKPPLTTTDRYAGLGPKFVYGGSEWYRPVKSVEVHNNQAISNTNRQVIPQSNQHALSDQIDIYPVVDTDGTEEEPYDLPKSRHNHALYYTTKGEERYVPCTKTTSMHLFLFVACTTSDGKILVCRVFSRRCKTF